MKLNSQNTNLKNTITNLKKTNSIRNYAYAALLTVSALSLSPATASAQAAGGKFSLPHAVRWQNVVVPAGDYRFSIESMGPSEMLKITKVSGAPASFMLLAQDTQEFSEAEPSRIVLHSQSGVSYVSEMDLPEFDRKMYFATPPVREKEIATSLISAR